MGAHGRWLLLSDDWAWAEHGWLRLLLGFPRGSVSLGSGRRGSARTPVSPVLAGWLSVGIPLLSGHTGREAGCLSLTRVSQASATISRVIALSADDDEATARSLIGRFGRYGSPALPISGGDRGPTYLRGGGFLPSRKCLGASSPPTPLNGYTFTPFRRHPCRHGRSSIRLKTIHVHYCERLVPFPTHDNSSSIQHFGDKCRAEPRELQLRSPRSFPRYVVNPYQLSRLVLSPLDLIVVVMFLVQRRLLQPRMYWWSGSRRPLRLFNIAQSHSLQIRLTSARIPGQ